MTIHKPGALGAFIALFAVLSACSNSERTISFSEGTKIPFCISLEAAKTSVTAAADKSYFSALNRLNALEKERLCTQDLSMANIESMNVRPEEVENDDQNARVFMIASIPRDYFSTCEDCDKLRSSDRLYFIVYNELGDSQYGWQGYVRYIIDNRTASGILDFFFNNNK